MILVMNDYTRIVHNHILFYFTYALHTPVPYEMNDFRIKIDGSDCGFLAVSSKFEKFICRCRHHLHANSIFIAKTVLSKYSRNYWEGIYGILYIKTREKCNADFDLKMGKSDVRTFQPIKKLSFCLRWRHNILHQ